MNVRVPVEYRGDCSVRDGIFLGRCCPGTTQANSSNTGHAETQTARETAREATGKVRGASPSPPRRRNRRPRRRSRV